MTVSLSRFDPIAAGHLVLLAEVSGIDMTMASTTNLYTVPAGKTLYAVDVLLEVTANTATGAATAGVGVAAGEDDVYPSEALTNFLAVGSKWSFLRGGKSRTVPAASVLKLGVDVAATGGAQTARAKVFGSLR